jgi:hypothetical protein
MNLSVVFLILKLFSELDKGFFFSSSLFSSEAVIHPAAFGA